MAILETNYMGLALRNPLIVASSGLTSSVRKLAELELAGAGAVVLKSVFEEQIRHETSHLDSYADQPEGADYLKFYLTEDYLAKYIALIKEAKRTLSIPVIASICCIKQGEWVEFARRIEAAGADALELNIFLLPTDMEESSEAIEGRYLSIVESVTSAVSLPVAVKIGSRFTNLLGMLNGILARGAKAVVMFNRFYEPDIDINGMNVSESDIFSTSSELRNSIRWIALSSSRLPQLDIVASTGVHTGRDAVKVLLAGAKAYEVCSEIYDNGMSVIEQINSFVSSWMGQNGFERVEEFVGKVNYSSVHDPLAFERAQFMKYYSSREMQE